MRNGYYKRQELKWLHTRWLGTIIANVNLPKGKQLKPSDMIPLSFDKVEPKKLSALAQRADSKGIFMTQEEIRGLMKKHGMLKDN